MSRFLFTYTIGIIDLFWQNKSQKLGHLNCCEIIKSLFICFRKNKTEKKDPELVDSKPCNTDNNENLREDRTEPEPELDRLLAPEEPNLSDESDENESSVPRFSSPIWIQVNNTINTDQYK